MNFIPACKRMIFCTAENQKVPDTWDGDQIRMVDLPFRKGDVQLGLQKLLFQKTCISDKGVGLHFGHMFLKIIHDVGSKAGADGNGEADTKGIFFLVFSKGLFHLVEQPDYLIGIAQEFLPGGSDIEPLGQPVEEMGVIIFFQFPDGLADCGLGKEKFLGSCIHGAALCYCNKNL